LNVWLLGVCACLVMLHLLPDLMQPPGRPRLLMMGGT